MSLVSKSDTGSDFANFSYRSSLPCRAHSASCRGCASVNKMENFARLPVRVHHILSIFSHQDKSQPQLSHFQFLDAAQTGTRAQRQPGDKQDFQFFLTQLRHRHRQQDKQDFQFLDAGQTQTHAQRQPGDEENKQDSYFNASSGLWVLLTQSFHINQYSAGLLSGAYISFQTLGRHQQSQNRPRF